MVFNSPKAISRLKIGYEMRRARHWKKGSFQENRVLNSFPLLLASPSHPSLQSSVISTSEIEHPSEIHPKMAKYNADYVIIGGGTAGLVLASRLTEDPTIRVIVLEAGENRSNVGSCTINISDDSINL